MTKCEEVRQEIVLSTMNKYVYCRMCDLGSMESVRNFVGEFRSKESRLDGLVNNAGVMNSPRQFSADGVEIHLAVNHLGHFLVSICEFKMFFKSYNSSEQC
jgi:retinol dehydrogenase-13